MPTVLRIEGFAFRLYSDDHPPAHVHVVRAGEKVVVELETLSVRDVVGMRSRDVLCAVRIVAENRGYLMARWTELERKRGTGDA